MSVDVRFSRAFATVALSVAAGVTLAACSSSGTAHEGSHSAPSAAASSVASGNASDVLFAQMMIPHHEQAVEMAALAAPAGAGAQVQELADQIAAAQGPEIAQMTAMLDRWGADPMTDHSGHAMEGMVSDADMDRLRSATGPQFDQLFLELMIAHHEGAIAMTKDPMANGADPELRTLLEDIVTAQTAEIEQMRALLAGS